MEYISSRNNEKIKQAAKICADSSERKRTGMFFLEGVRLCCDAAKNGIEVVTSFVTENALKRYSDEIGILIEKSGTIFLITEEISSKLSDTKNAQGVFCTCKTLDKFHNIDKINYNGIYIAAENIQTPGNLGAVVRTAEALGLSGLIVSGGCDIYNPKAQRAAMGSLLRMPVIECDDMAAFLTECREKGMKTYAAVPDEDALPVMQMNKTSGVVCVVGNEGNGLTEETIKSCCDRITVPMKGRAESLNAAAAASIIMWEMVR